MEANGSASQRRVQRLRCSMQNYDWGRFGRQSRVARLFSLNSGVDVDEAKPYAEFWMGTHNSGPSFVLQSFNNGDSIGSESLGLSLNSWIAKDPGVLGDKVIQKWGVTLPFLFKVLSVSKALSIQAHPDKEFAGFLHKTRPDVFKDDNHKPEMALALTEFEALCGFISLKELKDVLQNVPEIVEVVGSVYANKVLTINHEDGEEKVKSVLRSIFTQLMSASKDVISKALSNLKSRLNQVRQLTDKEQLVLRLEKQYPADVGVIAAFLFNYVKLKPGEALYLGANELHAYLHGECIECMATSDNVVRAGLTPKSRDVQILCSMLTYKQGFPEILQGVPLNPYTRRYLPPFDEFEVDRCILPQGASVVFPAVPGPSVFVIMEGEGTMHASSFEDVVREGDVLFTPANTDIIVRTASELHLYRAGVNSRVTLMETVSQRRVRRLRCSMQNYDSGFNVDETKPYAEFWMGTHESRPSFILQSFNNGVSIGSESVGLSLNSWIAKDPSVLGDKVLSIAKAGSIQAHPDKELTEFLHKKTMPGVFKDDNHKPEMALALADLEALCGFISLKKMGTCACPRYPTDRSHNKAQKRHHVELLAEELKDVLQNFPEIAEVVGSVYANQVLNINHEDGEEKVRQLTDKEHLVLHLEKKYPADVGVLAAFLFNYVKLKPGEVLYLGANELHAYLHGECIECMATADNVVRAGLTSKNRDVQILCSMLTYKQGFPEILQGVPLNRYTRRYLPPFHECEVDCCILPKEASAVFPAVPAPPQFLWSWSEKEQCMRRPLKM
ncbi:unnamed protein product [Camellia sinensis]